MRRRNAVAGRFYPSSRAECERQLAECVRFDASAVKLEEPAAGGIVPHAGWVFSGPTAGKVFAAIRECGKPETFVLFGATHRFGMGRPSIMIEGTWETPIGDVEVDHRIANEILRGAGDELENNPRAHEGEHSIEVQVPFIRYLFPEARIVPVSAPPGEDSIKVGSLVGEVMKREGGAVVAVGSTDLTHYGAEYGFAPKGTGDKALKWVREENDRRMVDLITGLKVDDVLDEERKNRNACGAGAVAATLAAVLAAGRKRGVLLEYTTSHDVMPERGATMFVGYAGVVF